MDWSWNRTTTEHGHGWHHRAPDARYCVLPNKAGDVVAGRITGSGNEWGFEILGTFIFAANAKEACYERARREAAAEASARSGLLGQTSTGGQSER